MPHTPGPWHAAKKQGWINAANGRRKIVQYAGCGSHAAEWPNPDDYKLAVAAPDLLTAAKAKLADCEDCKHVELMPGECCSHECAALAMAVAKAEGRDA